MPQGLRALGCSVRDFFREGGTTYAASLSFFFLVGAVPMCLVLAWAVGQFVGIEVRPGAFVAERLAGAFPEPASAVMAEIKKLIKVKGIAVTTLALYGLLAYQLYAEMHRALEAAFKVNKKRSFFGAAAISLIVGALVIVLLLSAYVLITMFAIIKRHNASIPGVEMSAVYTFFTRYLLPFGIVLLVSALVYKAVPKKLVAVRHALWGGFFTAVMLEAAKHLFTWYVGSVVKLGTLYGSLAAIVTFLLWVYYSWMIFLIGAGLTHHLGETQGSRSRA